MPSVRAYHLILTVYGFWLPNDPRGSWSEFVRDWELLKYGGEATKTDARQSVAHTPHDRAKRHDMKRHLARAPVMFNGMQARAVARGFADYAARTGLIVHACAMMPDHAHLVVARHTCDIEQVAVLLKGAATTRLTAEGLHPFARQPYKNGRLPTPWAHNCWKCFLWNDDDIARSIAYAEANPEKEGKARQTWSFVKPFTV